MTLGIVVCERYIPAHLAFDMVHLKGENFQQGDGIWCAKGADIVHLKYGGASTQFGLYQLTFDTIMEPIVCLSFREFSEAYDIKWDEYEVHARNVMNQCQSQRSTWFPNKRLKELRNLGHDIILLSTWYKHEADGEEYARRFPDSEPYYRAEGGMSPGVEKFWSDRVKADVAA